MGLSLSILYRGPLSSCNYDCAYCPFAKRHETAEELTVDREQLRRLVDWIVDRDPVDRLAVFFTPWGEALTRRWYRAAMIALSNAAQITKVAVQTNLSCQLDWLDDCRKDRVGLWCTYHPSQTTREKFLDQCRELDRREIRYSVGVVGLKENFADIDALREQLPPAVYLWVNAFKSQDDYYAPVDVARLAAIDPLFRINNTRHASFAKACRTGETVISVDGAGDVRRCHFIKRVIGNIYTDDVGEILAPSPCPNDTCGCHIGYVYLEELELEAVFGDGILERVPRHGASLLEIAEGQTIK